MTILNGIRSFTKIRNIINPQLQELNDTKLSFCNDYIQPSKSNFSTKNVIIKNNTTRVSRVHQRLIDILKAQYASKQINTNLTIKQQEFIATSKVVNISELSARRFFATAFKYVSTKFYTTTTMNPNLLQENKESLFKTSTDSFYLNNNTFINWCMLTYSSFSSYINKLAIKKNPPLSIWEQFILAAVLFLALLFVICTIAASMLLIKWLFWILDSLILKIRLKIRSNTFTLHSWHIWGATFGLKKVNSTSSLTHIRYSDLAKKI